MRDFYSVFVGLGSKAAVAAPSASSPLHPSGQTWFSATERSVQCPDSDIGRPSFDHLVGAGEHRLSARRVRQPILLPASGRRAPRPWHCQD